MNDEWIARLRRLVGVAEAAPHVDADLTEIDDRLGSVERSLSDIVIRLRLLERQADPRNIRGDHGTR